MATLYRAPRGTADILPQEQPYWELVKKTASQLCQLYGYQRLDTPVFESAELFQHSVGEETDIVEKEMYIFEDRSEQQLALRPEGTASICRAYLEHGMFNLPQPVRLYYLAPVFRYERPQTGRYRQHYQFGVEALGEADPALDAEVIGMSWHFYQLLGLRGLSLKLNSLGCRHCRPKYLDGLSEYYAHHAQDLCPNCQSRVRRNILRLLDCKQASCQQIAQEAPKIWHYLCPECQQHFDKLKGYLQDLGLSYQLEARLVRGLDYYTKTVFEVQPEIEGGQSTLGGGGRYDDLIEQLGGRPTPAVGFATGLERVILNLQKQGVGSPSSASPKVYLAYLGETAKVEAMKLAAQLRQAGIGIVVASGDKSLKAQLKQANSWGMSQVIIIGEEELKMGQLILRDMKRGEQEAIAFSELLPRLGNEKLTSEFKTLSHSALPNLPGQPPTNEL
jgi:histidyl-tRNA synthetase